MKKKAQITNTRPEHRGSEKVTRMRLSSSPENNKGGGGRRGVYIPPLSSPNYFLEEQKKVLRGLDLTVQKMLLDYLLLLVRENEQRNSSRQDRNFNLWQDSLCIGLRKVLGRSFPILVGVGAKRHHGEIEEFLIESGLKDLKLGERKVCYNIFAKILIEQAVGISARARIPLTMKLVLQSTTPFVSLFDNHFPGYAQAGMVRKIILHNSQGIIDTDTDEE